MNFAYCSNCGHDTLIKHTDTHYRCTSCGQDIYNNPRATVAVVFLRGKEALFSKRGIEPNKGKYDFPGGFIEYNENPYAACVREVSEETSVAIMAADCSLLTAYTSEYLPNVSVTDLIFVVRRWKGKFTPSDDSASLEWKPLAFIDAEAFAPEYPGLVTKLAQLLGKTPL